MSSAERSEHHDVTADDETRSEGCEEIAMAASAPAPPRSSGTLGAGLLMLLAVLVMGAAVLPQPRWDLWLVGVLAVLGLSLTILILAVLPRGRANSTSEHI